MNKNLLLSGIAVTAFLVSGFGKNEQSTVPFESEEMVEDMNSTLSNEVTLAPDGSSEDAMSAVPLLAPDVIEAFDPAQYVKPTNEEVQQSLKNAGFYTGSVDGVVGPRTKKAIRDFQVHNNLNSDGRIGPQTWAKLGPYLHQTQDNAAVVPADASQIDN
jgi:murein L,D-transpeptidase YcbB/YkuD